MGHISSRNHLTFQTAVFISLTIIAIKISINSNPSRTGLETRTFQQGHASGVVVNSRQVVTDDTGTGVSAAEAQRGLFR